MIWENVLGHETPRELLERSLQRGRLPHALLFAGPDGIGKRLFARLFAQCLFCRNSADDDLSACGTCSNCKQMQAGSHPDFFEVARPAGKKELPIELFVGSPEKRGREGLCHDLSLSPMSAARKVAVIDDTNFLNDASANALLKTLEEPPAKSIIILLANQAESLLPTIRSRCQTVRFAPLTEANLAELILRNEWATDPEQAASIAALSQGSLSTAEQLVDSPLQHLRSSLLKGLARKPFRGHQLAEEMIAGIDELGTDTSSQRANASWLISFLVEFFRQALKQHSLDELAPTETIRKFADRFDPDNFDDTELLMQLIERCAQAELQIQYTAPVPLCLESLFTDLDRIQRGMPVG